MRHDQGAWATDHGPFWEMIAFSDCEGVIGSSVSAKLAKDFAEWDERAKRHIVVQGPDGWFYEKFCQWRQAYEMAANDGLVQFA